MSDGHAGVDVVLGAYPATQCPVRTQYTFDPSISGAPVEISPELQQIIDAGIAFEANLFEQLVALAPHRFHLVDADASYVLACADTLAAMDRGVEVILGGALPRDPIRHRSGRPDLLIRHGTHEPAVYLPGEVKLHNFLSRKPSNARHQYAVTVAPASDPNARRRLPEARTRTNRLETDGLQLAHYTRMLEAIGRHPGPDHHQAYVISGDDWSVWGLDEVHGTWVDLDNPVFSTYSRSEGTKKRSALERYDHEFGFRVLVAQNAAVGGDPLVVPIYTTECDTCPWRPWCEPTFAADPTTSFGTWRPTLREWLALRTLGITTVEQLAALELTPEWIEQFHAEAGASPQWRKRLDLTIAKAKVTVAGHEVVHRGSIPEPAPTADVEIDLDMENDICDRVFLWGARIRRAGHEAKYHFFVDWSELDDQAERAVADQLTEWLAQQRDCAASNGESIAIFHHGDVERYRLRKIQGDGAVEAIGVPFVDTHRWAVTHLISTPGHGLKPLAQSLGFEWDDEDAGGRNCQLWLEEARATTDPTRRAELQQRILRYNEDDTAATAWIRDHTATIPTL